MEYKPPFSHAHYHSYTVEDGQLRQINPQLRQRIEDIALLSRQMGARSVLDIGCNFGGLLFFLEKFGRFKSLEGIEANSSYIREANYVANLLDSNVRFRHANVLTHQPDEEHDVILLQNVYHYLYDEAGSHEAIFKVLHRLGRSVIWYNPMTEKDPVIPLHANKNKKTNWGNYNKAAIFAGAIKAGFLFPLPITQRFKGMGQEREHYLFVRDEVTPIAPHIFKLEEIRGTELPVRDHFKTIHRVVLDDARAYKIFLNESFGQIRTIEALIQSGVLDSKLCGSIDFVVDTMGKVVGYSQPRGVDFSTARDVVGHTEATGLYRRAVWRLLSRTLRAGAFTHDVGSHNFVFLPSQADPIMIDIDNFVLDPARLSIYARGRDPHSLEKAEANFKLPNLFADFSPKVESYAGGAEFVFDALLRSNFLKEASTQKLLER